MVSVSNEVAFVVGKGQDNEVSATPVYKGKARKPFQYTTNPEGGSEFEFDLRTLVPESDLSFIEEHWEDRGMDLCTLADYPQSGDVNADRVWAEQEFDKGMYKMHRTALSNALKNGTAFVARLNNGAPKLVAREVIDALVA